MFAFLLNPAVYCRELSVTDPLIADAGMGDNHVLIPWPPQILTSRWNVSCGASVALYHVTSTRIITINCLRVHSI